MVQWKIDEITSETEAVLDKTKNCLGKNHLYVKFVDLMISPSSIRKVRQKL